VAELFTKGFPEHRLAKPMSNRPGKFLMDLPAALDVQLTAAGVRPENCYDVGACTCCNTGRFFSYRAEGIVSGRMMSVIGKVSDR